MALVFYEPVRNDQCDRSKREYLTLEVWQTPPNVGDEVLMGSSDRWQVVRVEPFHADNETVYLAFVSKGEVPPLEKWSVFRMLEMFPKTSVSLCLTPDRQALIREWSMEGEPLKGQLEEYEATGLGTQTRTIAMPWKVDRVTTYLPISTDFYSAIHLCWCKEMAIEVAA